ncbi:rRNA maturation RNase YbeY [Geobacter sp. DSM 9736]|uniref:rRNA maturation RNase YbeY n=1 Tax=Geobacter sp. DSM 9736 TaxID=1277350 RepID=UPI000B5F4E5B|nr:rRNA maturation RNase YbeY [Geobacter sp. DSM 9736]SNB44994.1 probable rRNA maturation factor [Geobacter sp. DSM 9736]
MGYPDSDLSVSFVGDRTIRRLNREYLQRDKPTNVISFSLQEGEFAGVNPQALGDVVVSVDTARREADEGEMTLHARLVFLLLHGILHLTGFDHERSGPVEAERMEAKERELFELLKREGLA